MSGIYAADGSFNLTIVSGSVYTGLYAADGSYNVVQAPGNVYVGAYHPCGAWWVTHVSGPVGPIRAADGSLNVTDTPYFTGAQKVTVVSGSWSGGVVHISPNLLLVNGTNYLLQHDATYRITLTSATSHISPNLLLANGTNFLLQSGDVFRITLTPTTLASLLLVDGTDHLLLVS
jgi:hypothetical protein